MTVNTSRSMNDSLASGSTDGKYRKVRPNTEVVDTMGNEMTLNDRQPLHPFYGYGFITSEYPKEQQVNPGK